MATQIYMLAQHAEECAQSAAAAATMYKNLRGTDPTHLEQLAETAGQAAQRVQWSQHWLESYCPEAEGQAPESEYDQWVASVRQVVKQAAGVANTSAKACGV